MSDTIHESTRPATKTVYSICGMCTVRCPISVEVDSGEVRHIWGNPHALGGRQLCPRGAAGVTFQNDRERPLCPVIRDGERGSGRWKTASWEEALDYVAGKLDAIRSEHGPQAVVLSDRGGPHRDFHTAFLKAFGSPNHFTHHATCSNSVHNAHRTLAGLARNTVVYDYGRCRHLVAFGRNLLESLGTGEARHVIDLVCRGDRFTFFDVRFNVTASKATDFHVVRPGSDYAIVLALLRVLLREELYDRQFVNDWVTGLEALQEAVAPWTPAEAEVASGVPAEAIVRLARDLAAAAPHVIVHPGWMTAWGENDFYLRRAIYALNALLGTYEAPGGLVFAKGAGDCGVTLRTLAATVPEPEFQLRCDGIGSDIHHLGKGWGLVQTIPEVACTGQPYPIKAYLVMRHDPMASLPNPDRFKTALDCLDLTVSFDVNWSVTGWNADVVLPECTFLERTDNPIVRAGLKPKLALRQQAVEPRFDSRPRWWIYKQLAERLGLGHYFPYETIDDYLEWALADVDGVTPSSFEATGEVALTDEEIWYDRRTGLKLPTPSGKIELVSSALEDAGIPSWARYSPGQAPPDGAFRLITGKVAVHTQGRTTANNPILREQCPSNPIVINSEQGHKLGLSDGDRVVIRSNGASATGYLQLCELVHPEVAFTLHGFGDPVPARTRSYQQGFSDVTLARDALKVAVGGNCPVTDTFVTIERA